MTTPFGLRPRVRGDGTETQRYTFNGAIHAEGITWLRGEFHAWLGQVASARFPLEIWRWLYAEFTRVFDARDLADTQLDALH